MQEGVCPEEFKLCVCPQGPPICPFQSIQAAIDFARPGETIFVTAGNYVENVRIDKGDLTLRGEDPQKVAVQAKFEDEPVIFLTNNAQRVLVRGLKLTGGIRGLMALESGDLRLSSLIIEGSGGEGLFLEDVGDGELMVSRLEGNGAGASLVGRTSFRLTDNIIQGNSGCGLWADERAEVSGSHNAIMGNGGGDLCGAAEGREDLLDRRPPAPPQLTLSPSGWTNQERFEVSWAASDEDISGIAAAWYKVGSPPSAPADGARTQKNPFTLYIKELGLEEPEGEHPIFVWLEDGMGNKSQQNRGQALIRFDETEPTIKPVAAPKPNEEGFNNTDVTVFFLCEDELSGIKSCPEPVTVSVEPGECVKDKVVSGTAEDNAGNSAEASEKVSIDKEAPEVKSVKINGDEDTTPSLVVSAEVEITFKDDQKCSGVDARRFKFQIRWREDGGSWTDWKDGSCTKRPCKTKITHTFEDFQCRSEADKRRKTLVVQVRDLAGNLSGGGADSIDVVCISRFPSDWRGKKGEDLQEAIREAPSGATIEIEAGTYEYNWALDEEVKLRGLGEEQPILKGKEPGRPVISIESDKKIEVTLEKLTITGAKLGAPGITFEEDGIQVRGEAVLKLHGVRVQGNEDDGIEAKDSAALEIIGAVIEGNGGDGIEVKDSAAGEISDVQILGNGDDGIEVGGSATLEVQDSLVAGNGKDPACRDDLICNGIEVRGGAEVTIGSSTIENNLGWGVAAWLVKCGYAADDFTGTVKFQGFNMIADNSRGPVCL